ncbi:EcsC family protein [Lichenicola cladoniae]|uniref:EcsC family protein n=1 Tax=Lichenicola cladoniae TaxID=1484109 RepID=A0A6M8HMC1_9PROT|nr:EcsC family protein [Lichenicola cladoniae]NPD66922.1 EcsC family protein [Acetobacteraceae bacterium]QKE89477.1 EcsC family protein [Lichenicola cladoniae]
MSATTRTDLSPVSGLASIGLSPSARGELQRVLEQLESGRGVLVRLADLMGGAVGQATRLGVKGLGLAPGLQAKLRGVAESSISRAFDIAVVGLKQPITGSALAEAGQRRRWREHVTHGAVTVSGALGGLAGFTGLLPDIGFTTLTIMREIARIAREEGEDLSTPDARRACLEVFALRPIEASEEQSELGYFSARAVLRGRPVVMLLSEVASHYGLALSRKVALQMMPVAGALCGASLNAAFLSHYRSLARAHFTIRRLERTHGTGVREAVESIRHNLAERVATT